MASDKMQTTFSGVAAELLRVGQKIDAAPTDVVEYNTSQSLTGRQKEKARANIGAGTSNFSGNYNDLDNKPTLAAVATSGSYNDLNDKVIINQDLSASGFSPVEGKYYLHTGATISSITPLVLNTSPANIYFNTNKTVSEMVTIFEAFRNSATPVEVDSGTALYFFIHNKETPSSSIDPSTDIFLALYYIDSTVAAGVRTDGLSEAVYMLGGVDSSTGVVPYFSNANLIRKFGGAVAGWNTNNIPATWGVEIKYLQGQTQLDQFASSTSIGGGVSFTHGLIYHYINGSYVSIDNPTLATVALTGSYNDLTDTPTIPDEDPYIDNRGFRVNPDEIVENDSLVYTYNSSDYTAAIAQDSSYSSLTNVIIPKYAKNSSDGNWYKVTSIGSNAFFSCTGLISVTIGNSVTNIGSYAFWYCTGLTSVTIGNGVTSIASEAFWGCTGLTSVTIPDGVTIIGEGTFDGCNSLASITIPDSVTSIGSGAFRSCTGLTSVTIGNGVTSIASDAFDGCTNLTSITILRDDNSTISGAPWGATNATVTYYRRVSDSQITTWNSKADISDIPTFTWDATNHILTINDPS